MRTAERLLGLKAWVQRELCDGREMKCPAPGMDVTKIRRRTPDVHLGWAPTRANAGEEAVAACPGILIMPGQANARLAEEKRFDRYNNVARSQDYGQHLQVSMLFSVYEPGTRLPGFADSAGPQGHGADMSLLLEGTEQGLLTLMGWMDDAMTRLLGQRVIPNTDLSVEDASITYGLYTDQSYVVDKRPIYYGFVNASFACHANKEANKKLNELLM